MAKSIIVGDGVYHNPTRKIHLGSLSYIVTKYQSQDVLHALFKLSFNGKYIIIKGRSLAGALVMFVNDFNSFDPTGARANSHFYTHMYNHILSSTSGRFRIKIISTAESDDGFYNLLKNEQMALDEARYDPNCLNNQMDAYVPKYNESTGMHGWIPKTAVMNFSRWLTSAERKDHAAQYKK